MMTYASLLLVEVVCMVVLAWFTLSLYRLLQDRERPGHLVKLTRFSHRKEVILRPLREAETVGL